MPALGLGIVTPQTLQIAALEKDRRSETGTIYGRSALDIE